MPDIAWVDTIDVCQLKCPTCIRGVRGLENTSRKMPLEMFGAIVDRIREHGFRRIGLYNWTEPFLNKTLEQYVARVKAAGLWVSVSSTLSLRRIDNLEATLLAGLDLLTVSLSGLDQKTYEVNHVGGVLEYVILNMEQVRNIITRHGLRTHIGLRLIKFDYNAHQEPSLREYAKRMGFRFDLVEGVGHPKSGGLTSLTNEHFVRAAEEAAGRRSPEDEGKACELMFNQMAIDCTGDVYLCCAMPNYLSLRIGNFLEMSADDILVSKFTHPFCRSCTMPRRDRKKAENRRLSAALERRGVMATGVAAPSTDTGGLTRWIRSLSMKHRTATPAAK